jgi:hypothetical protein
MMSSIKKFSRCGFACKHLCVIFNPKIDQVPVVECMMCTVEDSWVLLLLLLLLLVV